MKCPVCSQNTLFQVDLEDGLKALQCKQCKGIWIPSMNYYRWLKNIETLPDNLEPADFMSIEENQAMKLSPETGRGLRRYKVFPDVEFYIDRDESTNSIWLDANEWEYLKSRNVHDNLHLIFMPKWQKALRDEESRKVFEELYKQRFGEDDYKRLKDIREWIYSHPKGGAMISYLTDSNPYKG